MKRIMAIVLSLILLALMLTSCSSITEKIGLSEQSATAVAAGYDHTIALITDGSVWAWGNNSCGQLGYKDTQKFNIFSSARKVIERSEGNSSTPKKIIASGVIAIAAGNYHTLALKIDGSLWAWGYNVAGQLGDGTTTGSWIPKQIIASGVTAITAGESYSLAIKADGSLWAWGKNTYGQLGDDTTTDSLVPKQIIASGVQAVAAGYGHNIALKTDGSLWAWGHNWSGALGDGTTTDSLVPKQIIASGVIAIAAGNYHTLALKIDGSLWAWGKNTYGQLGDGTTTESWIPTQIIASGVTAITAGSGLSIALKTDGSLWAWGNNAWGQLGDGTTTDSYAPKEIIARGVKAVAAGDKHIVAIKAGGSLWAWGDNWSGKLGTGATTNVNRPKQIYLSVLTKYMLPALIFAMLIIIVILLNLKNRRRSICKNCGKRLEKGFSLCEECNRRMAGNTTNQTESGIESFENTELYNALKIKMKLRKKLHIGTIIFTLCFIALIVEFAPILSLILKEIDDSGGIVFALYSGVILAVLIIIYASIRGKIIEKRTGLDKIHISMIGGSNSVNGKENTYNIEVFFENNNINGKETSFRKILKHSIIFVGKNSEYFKEYDNESEDVYLPYGKTKVTFEIITKKRLIVKCLYIFNSGSPLVISDISGASVKNEVISTMTKRYKMATREKMGQNKRNIWRIIVILLLCAFLLLQYQFNILRIFGF